MSRIRLFIVDVDPVHTINVCKSIASISNIEIIGTEEDGSKALKRISALHPDVLLTDIQLPGLDGIGLLKEIQLLRHPPITIVCTRFYSDISLEYAHKHGAAYFLYKPVEYHLSLIHICQAPCPCPEVSRAVERCGNRRLCVRDTRT